MKIIPTWGVDLSDVALRAVKLALGSDGKPTLVAWDNVDFTEEVEDLTDVGRFATIGRGVYHFNRRHALKRSRVYVDLRGETAFNRTVMVPQVNDEGLDKILEYEAQQQIPFPLDEVFWDRRVVAIQEDGEVLATLYAVRRGLVDDRLRKIFKAQLPVDALQLRPVALHNFCAIEHLLEEGTIVVDVDYDGIQVLVHHDDQTWFRCLPVGAVDYVTRLREAFKVRHRAAVRMASGEAKIPDPSLLELCREASTSQIGEEIVRTLRYYLAARPEVEPSGIILLQSHACAPPIGPYLKEALKLPVFRPKGFRHIHVDPDVVTAGIQENFGGLAKAAGLALQGITKAEVAIRLYPEELERNLSGRRRGYVAAALVLLLALGWVGWTRSRDATRLEEGTTALKETLAEGTEKSEIESRIDVRSVISEIDSLAEPARGREGVLPLVDRLVALRAAWTDGEAPQVPAIRYGRIAGQGPGRVEVVLALRAADETAARKSLDGFAAKIGEDDLVSEVTPLRSWTAGWPSAEPAEATDGALLRWRVHHRAYRLKLAGATP